ncbi:hypothetical protein [uncultured Corynebacterium sp.]|uniref:hypothetical protein n=1 Tax=uncultured Corynebacterium sp. TaxID=159447 RepID=UPI00262C1D7F|nr:hypothetical protein [uncultured Corynebacterium sp.]
MSGELDNRESEIVLEMIQRLRDLQGIDENIPMTRRIIAGHGLTGGGTLERDVTIDLSQEIRQTISDLQAIGAISSLVTAQELTAILDAYAKTADRKPVAISHDFTVMEAPSDTISAPLVMVDVDSVITRVNITAVSTGSLPVKATIDGTPFTLSAGSASKSFRTSLAKAAGSTIALRVAATDAAGILVSLRLEEK